MIPIIQNLKFEIQSIRVNKTAVLKIRALDGMYKIPTNVIER